MPSKETLRVLARLDEAKAIDKRHVLWWQFEFEGRRIVGEKEFNQNLMTITYSCWSGKASDMQRRKRSFRIWKGDDVPVMVKKVEMFGEEVECFFSIKPLTHEWGHRPLEKAIDMQISTVFPVPLNNRPHIRGIRIGHNDEFFFWYPLLFGTRPGRYDSLGFRFKSGELALLWAVHPDHFYDNLVKSGWPGGKRAQRKPMKLQLTEGGMRIVPFYEFDPRQNHVMVYPARVWNDSRARLDVPLIVRGRPETGQPEILGTGSLHFDTWGTGDRREWASYWELADSQKKVAVQSLIERLGRIRR
jgi:hypothetical protein